VLHCLAHPADAIVVRITATTLAGALDLADYFLAHAARVLAAMRAATIETHSTPERTAILADVRRHGPTGPAEVAERLGKNPSTVRTLMVKMADAALLSKAGYGLYQCVDVDTVDTSSRSIRQPIDTVDTVDVRGGTVAQVSTVSMSTVNQHAVLDQCRVCGRPLRNAAERAAGVHDYACGNNQPDF
jgi:hypothetical protein